MAFRRAEADQDGYAHECCEPSNADAEDHRERGSPAAVGDARRDLVAETERADRNAKDAETTRPRTIETPIRRQNERVSSRP